MKVIIFGLGNIAQLAYFYLKNDSPHEVIAFTVDREYRKTSTFEGLEVLDFESISKSSYDPSQIAFFAPLYDTQLRARKFKEIKEKGFQCVSYVSSKSTCWSTPGENCLIMEDNTIQPFVSLGNSIIMWSGNHIGHHSVLNNNVFFSSHVVLCGNCTVEENSWFGVNSSIREHVKIAEGTFIAMGAVVMANTEPYTKYRGNPAKKYGRVE